mmetsp:Transcript_13282/g.19820  ORF Transcript_13282/g.19820 Transcript_13282/m.19820 type:complete len:201 (-) Transcript_13282:219-821(-)
MTFKTFISSPFIFFPGFKPCGAFNGAPLAMSFAHNIFLSENDHSSLLSTNERIIFEFSTENPTPMLQSKPVRCRTHTSSIAFNSYESAPKLISSNGLFGTLFLSEALYLSMNSSSNSEMPCPKGFERSMESSNSRSFSSSCSALLVKSACRSSHVKCLFSSLTSGICDWSPFAFLLYFPLFFLLENETGSSKFESLSEDE